MSELNAETRAFLEGVAGCDGPRPEDRARIRERLAVELGATAFAVGALAGGAQAKAAGSVFAGKLGSSWLAKLAGGVLLATGASAAVVVATRSEPAPSPVRQAVSARSQGVVVAPVVQPTPQPNDVTADVPAPEPERAAIEPRRARGVARARAQVPEQAEQAQDTMAAELALLQRAHVALRVGRPAAALAAARDHAQRYPDGVLREERAVLEVLARCELGSITADEVEDFLASRASSPLTDRVRTACKVEP